MAKVRLNEKAIIDAYNNGESLNQIARTFDTYAPSVMNVLERHGVELRHDNLKKGSFIVEGGEELIEWAKAQGRLVTKAELAKVAGTKRLSNSYFKKYPELSKYIKAYEHREILPYTQKLFDWLNDNNIPYIPNDASALEGISVQATLLQDYEGTLIVVAIKPTNRSKKLFNESIERRANKAKEKGLHIIFLKKEQFENLDQLKELLCEKGETLC